MALAAVICQQIAERVLACHMLMEIYGWYELGNIQCIWKPEGLNLTFSIWAQKPPFNAAYFWVWHSSTSHP